MHFSPTLEQQAVIEHEHGHARVLAVAGAGKTTTMVGRIGYLANKRGVDPSSVTVLMFNKKAQLDFVKKLMALGFGEGRRPTVATFHSCGLQLVELAKRHGLHPNSNLWTDEESEKARWTVRTVIQEMVKGDLAAPGELQTDDLLESIGLWKGALTPPERAGHRSNELLVEGYGRFEQKRVEQNAMTFDDFIPTAVWLLENNEDLRVRMARRNRFLIVDEYQDVNYGQQRLVELLASEGAEIMVVGDDDQTIYEWRGARPDYIIREFESAFDNLPHATYKLTHTFRFGPVLAQGANNSISRNANRQEKALISHTPTAQTSVHLYTGTSSEDPNEQLAAEVLRLVQDEGVEAGEVRVLSRMWAQLAGLESRFLINGIPYRMERGTPFFKRSEVQNLLCYLQLVLSLDSPLTRESGEMLERVVNFPNRRISKRKVSSVIRGAVQRRVSLDQALQMSIESDQSDFWWKEKEGLVDLRSLLRIGQELASQPDPSGGVILERIAECAGLGDHFKDYYGDGQDSHERQAVVAALVKFAKTLDKPPLELLEYVEQLDTTMGLPDNKLIVMTTAYQTKGLEYDHVIIPDCAEGFMPCLVGSTAGTYDKENEAAEPKPSLAIENERRLFYVAITRARKSLHVGFPAPPPPDESQPISRGPSRFIEELRVDENEEVLAFLPDLPGAPQHQRSQWLESVKAAAGNKRLVDNLIVYLKRLGEPELAGAVAVAAAAVPESPFKYTRAFSGFGKATTPSVSTLVEEKAAEVWSKAGRRS